MSRKDEPMPLSELPTYLESVRQSGQGDYIPVVDVGRIVESGGSTVWFRRAGYMAVAGLFLGLVFYGAVSTREITVVTKNGDRSVSEIVAEDGGRVVSVRKNTDGSYRVRVFAFGGIRALVEKLKESKELERVDLED